MQVIFAIIFISYLVITVVKLIWFLKEEGMSFSIPKVLFLICIITEILLFLFLIDPLGYHQKLNQLQLIMFELNLFFAFLMTIMVVVSFKFLIILLKISQKNKMKPLIYSISFILISVSDHFNGFRLQAFQLAIGHFFHLRLHKLQHSSCKSLFCVSYLWCHFFVEKDQLLSR